MGRKKTIQSYITAVSFAVILCIMPAVLSAQSTKHVYKAVFIKNLFLDVNLNDAKAALAVWIKEMSKTIKVNFTLEPVIINDINELDNSSDDIILVNCTTTDFLENRDKLQLEGTYVAINSGSVYNSLILVAKKDLQNIKMLKQKRIGIQREKDHAISCLWLNSLLNKNKQPDMNNFFKQVLNNGNQSQLLMSVFFGQLDACIITRDVYDVMAELNPQIAKALKIVEESDGFVFGIACFRKSTDSKVKDKIMQAAKEISGNNGGRQVLTLLNTSNITAYKEEYMNSLKKLIDSGKKNSNVKKNR